MFGLCVAEREPVGTHPPESASDPAPFGLHALWRAYRACRKGKRHTRDAQQYQARLLDGLVQARDALASVSWRPSPHLCFVVDQPKRREIHAAPFADRVVHHLLTERLARLYEPVFIYDSYANRKGKGTLAAVDRLQQCMRSGAAGQGQPGQWYALQLDIANFFNRIHRPTLFGLLQHRLVRAVRRQGLAPDEARTLQTLCRALLQAAPTEGVRRKGPPARFAAVPPHKRLAAQEPGRGLPIGNLTSQFFANVYLNELDQFVKHQLKARHYLRYVDDFVLLHPDPAQLVAWRDAIEAFLAQRLGLALKERSTPRHVSAGVDFLGYIVRPHYRLVRRRTVRRMHRVLAHFAQRHVHPRGMVLPHAARERLHAQVASYRAQLSHAASARLWQRTLAGFPWLTSMFANAAVPPGSGPLQPAWVPASVTGVASQYRYFARRHPQALVLMQVGNRWVLPQAGRPVPGALPAHACEVVPGLGGCHVWRPSALPGLRQWLKRQGLAHVLVAQDGHFKTGFKRRALWLAWHPQPPGAVAGGLPSSSSSSSSSSFQGVA